jgi:cytochrome o ubiquinol oxidase subunit 2
VKNSSDAVSLDLEEYGRLAKPSENHPVKLYLLKEDALFHQILMKYMSPKQ